MKTRSSSFQALAFLGLLAACATACAAEKSAADSIPTADGPLTIHPLNHATLALQWKDTAVYVDPVGGAKMYEGLPRPSLVLITHSHGDHFNRDALAALSSSNAKLIGPQEVIDLLPADWRSRATALPNGRTQEVSGIRIEAVPAYNLTPARQKFHAKGIGNGYVLTFGDKRIYVSGDTEDVPEMLALKNIDVAFLAINLPYTMDVEQAARAARTFKPRVVYPYHCRGSDLARFKELVGTEAEVLVRDWYRKF